ncbi:hypothetical protein [Neobacillus sp. FSL H8-0543]|uniref:hypothetical protein n=1 Tax=Neobacillus sp. FSL H8-0543 TaxID=2954672 RepID=UPI0031589D24
MTKTKNDELLELVQLLRFSNQEKARLVREGKAPSITNLQLLNTGAAIAVDNMLCEI